MLSALVTLHVLIHICLVTFSNAHIHSHTRLPSVFRTLLHTHPSPPPSGPVEGHAFVSRCQDAGVCSCDSRSSRFILFSRGCTFVCGPVSFRPTLPNQPPPHPERTLLCLLCYRKRSEKQPPPHSILLQCTRTTLKIGLARLGPRSHCEFAFNDKILFSALACIVLRARIFISAQCEGKKCTEKDIGTMFYSFKPLLSRR